jgi:hypothetical protein
MVGTNLGSSLPPERLGSCPSWAVVAGSSPVPADVTGFVRDAGVQGFLGREVLGEEGVDALPHVDHVLRVDEAVALVVEHEVVDIDAALAQ